FKAKLLEADVTNPIAFNALGDPIKIDSNNDSEIQTSEALNVYRLKIFSSPILNFTGIESFVNITALDCTNNVILTLDVSALTNLTTLNCSGNLLTSLDVSALTNLKTLSCGQN